MPPGYRSSFDRTKRFGRLNDEPSGLPTITSMSPTKASIKPGELTPFAIYTCRHTYTTRLLAAGVPNAIVDQLIGHGRRRGDVLRFYSARVMEYLRDAVRDLEELRKTKESAFKIHDAIGTLRHIAKGSELIQ